MDFPADCDCLSDFCVCARPEREDEESGEDVLVDPEEEWIPVVGW